jgi:crossover junction endodeoxyribonuclease RuvC
MRILGIDPGYGRLGYAVIDVERGKPKAVTYGVITTEKGARMPDRLFEIAADVRSVIVKYTPERFVIEELFFAKSTTTALKVAEVRGVMLLLAAEAGMDVVEVKPNAVKLALTGYGKADKRQMQDMVKVVFDLKKAPKIDDAADALAIAWCGAVK